MLKVVINGKYTTDRMQGIVRYARELLCEFDKLLDAKDDVVLVVPQGAHDIPSYANIRVERYGRLSGIPWEQVDLARYLLLHPGYVPLNLCNVAPLLARPGVTTIHDIMYKACPEFYTTTRNRVSRLWHCAQYALLTCRERAILTDSEYSKQELERYYPRSRGKVRVVPAAWQHVLRYNPAPDWQDRYPQLKPGEYLFSMATLSRNKNGRWIYEAAKNNPNMLFALAGKRYETDEVEKPSNVLLLGFISDEDACALIQNCRAFVYPSIYEGYGLPPIEALALGAEVVSSNTTSLPEVLGNAVHYIDPTRPDVNLTEILQQPVGPTEEQLRKFSWKKSAGMLQEVLQ